MSDPAPKASTTGGAPEAQIRFEVLRLAENGDFLGAFQELLASNLAPVQAPATWELLAARASAGGAHNVAQEINKALWKAKSTSAEVALSLARQALGKNRSRQAEFFVVNSFGSRPVDGDARLVLAAAIADRAPNRALKLLDGQECSSIEAALLTIDILRRTDRLIKAASLVRRARLAFPAEVRLDTRSARIAEALNDWEAALSSWNGVAERSPKYSVVAGLQRVKLCQKLERPDQAVKIATDMFLADASLFQRLILAEMCDQSLLALHYLDQAMKAQSAGALDGTEWPDIIQWLLDRGSVGVILWLWHRGISVDPRVLDAIQAFLTPRQITAIVDGTIEQAEATQSPDCLFPLATERIQSVYESVVDTGAGAESAQPVLLVNATLAAGGAERQFVALAEALIASDMPSERIHVALFSLVDDRGHRHFLPQLEALGVTLHDLRGYPTTLDGLPQGLHDLALILPEPLRRDFLQLWQLASKLRPQVIHGWQDRASLASGLVGLLQGSERIVMSARNMQPHKRGDFVRYAARLFRSLLDDPKVVLTANSSTGARDYESWLGLTNGSVATLLNGLNVDRFALPPAKKSSAARKSRNASRRVVTVGGVFRLAANKRPGLWLNTIARLREVAAFDVRPFLVGSGPFESELLRHAESLGFGNFKIHSNLTASVDIYGPIDCLLLMSRVEGTPNVVLEAQACGVPVAACDVGGVREALLLKGTGAGLLMAAEISEDAAADAIAAWLPGALDGSKNARQKFVKNRFGMAALGRTANGFYTGPAASILQD